jgi:hypothetical protein
MSGTYIPLDNLRVGLQTLLAVDALLSIVPGGVVDQLPETPDYEIVRVVTRGKPIGAIADARVWECEAEIDIYSIAPNTSNALSVADVIFGLLNHQVPVVDGWTVIQMAVLDITPIEGEQVGDQQVHRWLIPVLISIEKSA